MGVLNNLLTLGFVPRPWRLPCLIACGVLIGLGAATVHISRAPSYLSDSPETCVNCHVMGAQYLTWQHSSHHNVATCNDCHVPHDSALHKYLFKAEDGTIHSTIFTLHAEPQVIQLSKRAIPVVQANCQRCHSAVVDNIHAKTWQPGDPRCWDCHRETPHGRGRSLSTTPTEMRPALPGVFDDPRYPTQGGRMPNSTPTTTPTAKDAHP